MQCSENHIGTGRWAGAFVLALVLTATCVGQVSVPGTHALRVGASMVDITPKPSELKFKTDSIRDHLFARAIVVDDGNTCMVLVGLGTR